MQNSQRSPSSQQRPAVPVFAGTPARETAPQSLPIDQHKHQPNLVRTLAASALVVSLIAAASLTSFPEVGKFGVILSATLGLMAVHLALRGTQSPATNAAPNSPGGASHLERRFEQLQDLRWELRDNDTRYRELLDSLDDMIIRRDAIGNLTFVNRAFCRAFAIDARDCLGKPWTAPVVATDELQSATHNSTRRYCQKITLPAGERWIEWQEHSVPVPGSCASEQQFVGRDVTQRRRYEADLCHARDAALSANRAKSRFLATMSHEIRTPMNGILGMASLLEDTSLSREQTTYTRAIDQSARNLLSLIDEILDFSKIEAGKLVLLNEPFSIAHTIQSAVELLAPRAHEKKLDIAALIDRDVPKVVVGDPARVRQILLNLISNAVKFTDRGGISVSVSVARSSSDQPLRIVFAVEDTGIGLSKSDMTSLFAEFEQADVAAQRRDGGTGLGLAISKRLARAMGGDIAVESQLGRGSTFRFELPLPASLSTPPDEPNPDGDGATVPRVLLAFDRPKERASLAASLEAAGVPAVQVCPADAVNAIERAAAAGRPFDRIIVDEASSPDAMGTLLTRARELLPERPVRGIVLVNVLARAGLAPYRKKGFDSYLMRPVRPASLLEQIGLGTQPPVSVPHQQKPSDADNVVVPSHDAIGPKLLKTVLLAEDNAINALLATKVLEREGYQVTPAITGFAAIEAVRQTLEPGGRPFDLILMDIFMPGMDGVEAASEIKSLHPGGNCPPIIALTANAFAEDRQRYLDLGLDDYLAKPFDRAAMTALLTRWSSSSRLHPAA